MWEKKDHLSDLPDHLLCKIIRKLDHKEAVKTCILSKRWKYVWIHHLWINHRDIKLNRANILGLKFMPFRKEWLGLDTVFVKWVNMIMRQRLQIEINKVNSFYLEFPLGVTFSSSINRWIDFVVENRVETIDLDFTTQLPISRYNFSLFRTISKNKKRTLKHLRLTNCNFKGREILAKFCSLISLDLQEVNISTLQLVRVLESCPLLEELSLVRCRNLTKLTIDNTCSHLKHLSLTNCPKLKQIDVIHAQNLTSLELYDTIVNNMQLDMFIKRCPLLEELYLDTCPQIKYLRIRESDNSPLKYLYLMNCWELFELDIRANLLHTIELYLTAEWFSIIRTPNLVNVFIGEAVDLPHPITRIVHDISSVQNLIIAPCHTLNFYFSNDPVTSYCLKRLVLHVKLSDNDKDELLWVSYILKAFPFLKTLELNFRNLSKFENEETMTFEKCPNGSITKLEMNGFNGNQREVNVLMYLLENLTGLKELAIGPCYKRYKSFNFWFNEEARGKNLIRCNSEWLRTIVPLNVDLKFMEGLDYFEME